METRVIVAGSRDFTDYIKAEKEINKVILPLDGIVRIVSGHCRGADLLGERYAAEKEIDVAIFPAKWKSYGKRAGFIRNYEMAEFASEGGNTGMLIAFWDGVSRGTKMMIDIAQNHGLRVIVVNI